MSMWFWIKKLLRYGVLFSLVLMLSGCYIHFLNPLSGACGPCGDNEPWEIEVIQVEPSDVPSDQGEEISQQDKK